MQPVYKRTKSGSYVEVEQQQHNQSVNPAAYPPQQSAGPTAAYFPNYYGHNYPPTSQSVFVPSSDYGPPTQTPYALDPTRLSGFQLESARAKYFAVLRERGWIQNGHGQWYRDPNVEFEDEEELPPPAPPGLNIVIEIVSPPSS
jgi:hypothetical protein